MALSTYSIYEYQRKTDLDTLKCGFYVYNDMQPHKKNKVQNTLSYKTAVGKSSTRNCPSLRTLD